MIRLIVQRHEMNCNTGEDRRDFFTLDVDLPDLEAMLTSGGRGEMGFESWQLLGAEVLRQPTEGSGDE